MYICNSVQSVCGLTLINKNKYFEFTSISSNFRKITRLFLNGISNVGLLNDPRKPNSDITSRVNSYLFSYLQIVD